MIFFNTWVAQSVTIFLSWSVIDRIKLNSVNFLDAFALSERKRQALSQSGLYLQSIVPLPEPPKKRKKEISV